jgi:hypothetical protein
MEGPRVKPHRGLLVVDLFLGGRRRGTRQDASTTSHSHMRGLRGAQSRMTVLRREAARSYRASQGSKAPLSQSCDACPPDRAYLHPSTSTPKDQERVLGKGDPVRGLHGVEAHCRPDKPGELACDGNRNLRPGLPSLEETVEPPMEPSHGFVRERDDLCGHSLAALL